MIKSIMSGVLLTALTFTVQIANGESLTAKQISHIQTLLRQAPEKDVRGIEYAVKRFPNQVELPTSIPFKVTGAFASASKIPNEKNEGQLQIYFLNLSRKQTLVETILAGSARVMNYTKVVTLRNGGKAYFTEGQGSTDLSWGNAGNYYTLESQMSHNIAPLALRQLEQVANSMS